jgi:hypothetical protein
MSAPPNEKPPSRRAGRQSGEGAKTDRLDTFSTADNTPVPRNWGNYFRTPHRAESPCIAAALSVEGRLPYPLGTNPRHDARKNAFLTPSEGRASGVGA